MSLILHSAKYYTPISILQLWFISCFYLLGITLFFTDLKRTLLIYLNC